MKLKKVLAATSMATALGVGAAGAVGVGVASAAPGTPLPAKPGQCGRNFDCPPPPGPGWKPGPGGNRGDVDWDHGDHDFSVGSADWWRGRPGKWWRDGDLPPWGFWGPPPAVQWSGPPPWVNPHPINYWGYNVTPVWDDGFHGWGIWLFGIWIPIVGIQGY
ncbi:MAG TPA: hypothetical protein VFB19_16745 [Mycobacterium sp.]|nr:hypothetical protein [Mycobacterium sp.]